MITQYYHRLRLACQLVSVRLLRGEAGSAGVPRTSATRGIINIYILSYKSTIP